MILCKTISSLEKCFFDDSIDSKEEFSRASVLKNDRLSYQICFTADLSEGFDKVVCNVEVISPISNYITVSHVRNVPSLMPVFRNNYDDNYLRTTPGLYPDLLVPIKDDPNVYIVPNQLHSVWIDVDVPESLKSDEYIITILFKDTSGTELCRSNFNLKVCNSFLPEQKLIYTQWFHCDCLANYYQVPVFSEKHWSIIKNFISTAVKNGINMILTPVFTPALDTAVGHERLTTQLVKITVRDGSYLFDYSLLDRWINLCLEEGIEYFEISHLFTQWGAKHAPKIVANVDGKETVIFGWDTAACSKEYSDFLHIFLHELINFLKSKNVDHKCVFHISDEPNEAQLNDYLKAKSIVEKSLSEYKIIDALSNFSFYSAGAVKTPVVATDHIQKFIDENVSPLWAYYCCGECVGVSNRFLSMPSQRNRIIGVQLFKYGIQGFLHWGYNFYNNQFSIAPVDPYRTTDGDFFAPSGDTFSVYPAPDGTAYESIHLAVFTQALRDMRALEALAEKQGRDNVIQLIDNLAQTNITFYDYPKDASFIIKLREKVNELLG